MFAFILLFMFAGSPSATGAQSSSAVLPDVTVVAPKPPQREELAGEAIHDFIRGHAKPATVTGQLARWAEGLCPETHGLAPAYDEFVTARILAVAANVGAPQQPQEQCRPILRYHYPRNHPSGLPGSCLGSSISSSIVNVLIIADTRQAAGYEEVLPLERSTILDVMTRQFQPH